MSEKQEKSLSYRDAGVNIDAGNEFVEKIKSSVASTNRPGVMGSLGGFGGLFELPEGYQQPVLVSGTDGVGTKLKLAFELGCHDTIGIDLVAMSANDVSACGAVPFFFLDYIAASKLDADLVADVVTGMAEACEAAGCVLLGGETADWGYQVTGYFTGMILGSLAALALSDLVRRHPGRIRCGS